MTTTNIATTSAATAPIAAEKNTAAQSSKLGVFASLLDLVPSAQPQGNSAPQQPETPEKPMNVSNVLTLAQVRQMLLGAANGSLAGETQSSQSAGDTKCPPDASAGSKNAENNTAQKANAGGDAPPALTSQSVTDFNTFLETQAQLALAVNAGLVQSLNTSSEDTAPHEQTTSADDLITNSQQPKTKNQKTTTKSQELSATNEEPEANSIVLPFDIFTQYQGLQVAAQASSLPAGTQVSSLSTDVTEPPGKPRLISGGGSAPQGARVATQSGTAFQAVNEHGQDARATAPPVPAQDVIEKDGTVMASETLGAQASSLPTDAARMAALPGTEAGEASAVRTASIAVKTEAALTQVTVKQNLALKTDYTPSQTYSSSPAQNTAPPEQANIGAVANVAKQEPSLTLPNLKENPTLPTTPATAQGSQSSSNSDTATTGGNENSFAKNHRWASTLIPQEAVAQYAETARESTSAAERKFFPSLEKPDQEITTSTLGLSATGIDHLSATNANEAKQPVSAAALIKTTLAAIPNPVRATTIEIRPEGLGTIQIRLSPQNTSDGTAWRVDIRATNPTAQALLSDNLSALRQSLKTESVHVAGPSASPMPVIDAARQAKPDLGQGDSKGGFHEPERQKQREDRERKESFTVLDEES